MAKNTDNKKQDKEEKHSANGVSVPLRMAMDTAPQMQPEGTYRFALNATIDGTSEKGVLSTEEANEVVLRMRDRYNRHLLGSVYVGDNESVLFCVSDMGDAENYRSEILLFNGEDQYKVILSDVDGNLNFRKDKPIYATYRLRMGCEKTVYFTDNYNPPRYINISDKKEFFVTYPTDVPAVSEYGSVDPEKLRLQKCYSDIPVINVELSENGQLLSGSYNFSVRYVDSDMNPTEWIYTTEPVMIFKDKVTGVNFEDVRASTNDDVEYRKYGPTTKSLRVFVKSDTTDKSYRYLQFAMICATSGTGAVSSVVYSPLIEIPRDNKCDLTYLFTGGSDTLEGDSDEIAANNIVYDRVGWMVQADDRLVMADVTETDVQWCRLQKYASRITSKCVTEQIDIANIDKRENHKNPFVMFNGGPGYQPGEIYSFGIVYVLENGVKSPVYHIPGKSRFDNSSNMDDNNECEDMVYQDMAMSCEGLSYWGVDNTGRNLAGEKIRHHRFPVRTSDKSFATTIHFNKPSFICHYNLVTGIVQSHSISYAFRNHFNFILVKYDMVPFKTLTDSVNLVMNYTPESFEIEIDYSKFASGEKSYDVSEPSDNDYMNPILCSSNPFVKGKFYKYGKDQQNSPNVVEGGTKNFKLKKGKQYKYVDIYEYSLDDYAIVRFDKLQEYPQFVETNSDDIKKPRMFTTGSKITVATGDSGWQTGDSEKKEMKRENWVDYFESLDDTFFQMKYLTFNHSQLQQEGVYDPNFTGTSVKVLDANNTSSKVHGKSSWTYGNMMNGRRVLLKGGFQDTTTGEFKNIFVSGIPDIDNPFSDDSAKIIGSEYINSSIGFHVEIRIEPKQTIADKDLRGYRYGIQFENIEIPDKMYLGGHQVVGYYIVQNERTDEDTTIVDSAILMPLFAENVIKADGTGYKSIVSSRVFVSDRSVPKTKQSKILDKTKYEYWEYMLEDDGKPAGTTARSNIMSKLYLDGAAFINPQFKFNRKEYGFNKVILAGYFQQVDNEGNTRNIHYSTDFNEGWVSQDVQDGTSYNKELVSRKDKDIDGIDLHIYHKNSYVRYVSDNDNFGRVLDVNTENVHYLAPISYIDKDLNGIQRKLFNMSYDNNVGMMFSLKYDGADFNIGTMFRGTDRTCYLPYVYLYRHVSNPYGDFQTRPYYAATKFMRFVPTQKEACRTFNGDCFLSPMKYTTGSLYDIRMKKRKKKDTIAQYVIGSAMIAGGVATTVLSTIYAGGAANGVGMASVSIGISQIQNGMNIDAAYKNRGVFDDIKGKRAMKDGWVADLVDTEQYDDEIQWLFESIDNLWFESKINMNWRVGSNTSAVTDYLDPISGYNPSKLRDYFFRKLTYPDDKREGGRGYLGTAQCEIYATNADFQRRNKQKMMYCIPQSHKCCSECENTFPQRIVYSEKSFSEERVDNYRVFLPGNYKDVPGETGRVTAVSYAGNDNFLILSEEGLYYLPQTKQQRAVGSVVSFIGTGEYFSSDMQRMSYSDMNISYGCRHRGSVLRVPEGIFWYSEHDNKLYWQDGKQVHNLTEEFGIDKWFQKNGRISVDEKYYSAYSTEYPFKDCTTHDLGSGYALGYDSRGKRILITKKDNEVSLEHPICRYDASDISLQTVINRVNYIAKSLNGKNVCYKFDRDICSYVIDYETITKPAIDGKDIKFMLHKEYIECASAKVDIPEKLFDKSFTLSFVAGYGFVSFHSYLPNKYVSDAKGFCTWSCGKDFLFRHNIEGKFLEYYAEKNPFSIEIVNSDFNIAGPVITDSATIYAYARKHYAGGSTDERNAFFTHAYFHNSRQCTQMRAVRVKSDIDSENYLQEYMDSGETCNVEKRESFWHVNDIRDDVVHYDVPILTESRQAVGTFMSEWGMNGWMDVCPDPKAFGDKNWWELEPLSDTYICQRWFYNPDDTTIELKVMVETSTRTQQIDNQ